MANMYEIGDKTGEELARQMGEMTLSTSWQRGNKSTFAINGKTVAEIEPKPTPEQPGNGMMYFDGKAPRYEDLRRAANKNYPEKHQTLDKNPLKDGLNVKNKSDQFYFLSKFEEARRVPGDAQGYLSRNQVEEGNRRAIEQGRPRDMFDQFTGPPRQRQEAYGNIIAQSGSGGGGGKGSGSGGRHGGRSGCRSGGGKEGRGSSSGRGGWSGSAGGRRGK